MKEIHLTKKDFKIDWFSGSGAGGQKRNKVMACCRITHIESGLMCVGQNSRSRVENQRDAFTRLAKMVIEWYNQSNQHDFEISNETIRNYHAVRNEVHDKASGHKQSYKEVVVDGDLSEMIDARRQVMGGEDE